MAAAASSVNGSCFQLQARMKCNDSSNNFDFVTSGVVVGDNVKTVAGIATAWVGADGRSPNISVSWWGYDR